MPPSTGAPCWIEIPARDMAAQKKFYASAFPDWTFCAGTPEHPEDKVASFSFNNMKGLGGGIIQLPKGSSAQSQPMGTGFTVYYSVESIEEATERIHKLGGKTVLEKMPEGENGWFSNLTDPEGNRFGIYQVNPDGPWARSQAQNGN